MVVTVVLLTAGAEPVPAPGAPVGDGGPLVVLEGGAAMVTGAVALGGAAGGGRPGGTPLENEAAQAFRFDSWHVSTHVPSKHCTTHGLNAAAVGSVTIPTTYFG